MNTTTNETPEQQARDMLDRMGIQRAQAMSAGDVVELANLISAMGALIDERNQVIQALTQCHEAFQARQDSGVAEQALRHALESIFQMPYEQRRNNASVT